jgi:serine protease Do
MGTSKPGRLGSMWLALVAAVGLLIAVHQPVGLASLIKQAPADPDPTAEVQNGVVQITSNLNYQNAIGTGAGIVLSPGGEVLTNNHVVAGATSITATDVGTGKTYPVDVIGYDRKHDIALVQLNGASDLPVAPIGDSSALAVGSPIVALGNAGGNPLSHEPGTVAALGQTVDASDDLTGSDEQLTGLIEIAADLRPGDSGGPLVNSAGQVVGLNTAAALNYRLGTPAGHGFVIPIDQALAIASQIRSGSASGTVHIGPTGLLGVGVSNAQRSAGHGVVVQSLLRGGPAEQAGITNGSVLTTLDGTRLDSPNTLTDLLDQHHPGDTVTLSWVDGSGGQHSAPIVLSTGPAG